MNVYEKLCTSNLLEFYHGIYNCDCKKILYEFIFCNSKQIFYKEHQNILIKFTKIKSNGIISDIS